MRLKTPTIEQALEEGWYRPNEKGGYCHCGCGEKTQLARQSHRKLGTVKDQPLRFVAGHNSRGKFNGMYGKPSAMMGKSGSDSPRWRGGSKSQRGYLLRWVPVSHPMAAMRSKAGYIPEHRLIMAEYLGRPLRRDEVVYHKNRVRDDNRLENLELMHVSDHRRHHTAEMHRAYDLLERLDVLGASLDDLIAMIPGSEASSPATSLSEGPVPSPETPSTQDAIPNCVRTEGKF